jgi:AraC family L-rhamnose operon regulatory protein RhaS
MTVLRSSEYFPSGDFPVAIEPRYPQETFPEHHHQDFDEIVLVEQGTGTHVFNDQPLILSAGSVCFVRHSDHHLYEDTDNLHLTNVLYRSPNAFRFLNGVSDLLPQEVDGIYPAHWRISPNQITQAKTLIDQLARKPFSPSPENQAQQELYFMQLLLLLRKGSRDVGYRGQGGDLNNLLDWMNEHYDEEIDWPELAAQFSMSLRTLHRQMKQQTGCTPLNYLNRLRLLNARNMLRFSDSPITEIAHNCGFCDSNYFSTLFKREFGYAPRSIRQ